MFVQYMASHLLRTADRNNSFETAFFFLRLHSQSLISSVRCPSLNGTGQKMCNKGVHMNFAVTFVHEYKATFRRTTVPHHHVASI